MSTYDDILKNQYLTYDEITGKYSITNNNKAWNYIKQENKSGRMTDNTALALIQKYGFRSPVQQIGDNYIVITTPSGGTASLTVTSKTTREQILKWGNNYGVDLSEYV